jgi:hypothetical protein
VSDALLAYAQQANVLYAQPNWVSHIDTTTPTSITKTPNDPRYGEQWDWPKIGAPAAWANTTGSHSIVVTDIDTGMEYTHEDLAANAWQNTAECGGVKGKGRRRQRLRRRLLRIDRSTATPTQPTTTVTAPTRQGPSAPSATTARA